MSNFAGASLRDIQTIIETASAGARENLIAEAVDVLKERLAKAKAGSGKAKRTQAFIAQLAEGKPDYVAAFEASKTPKASKPKAKPKAKPQASVAQGVSAMSDADLAGMVAMLTTELANRNK